MIIAWLAALVVQCPDGTPPPCAGTRAPLPVLVVTPFENRSRDTADSYLAATLTEDVTAALAASHAVRLVNPRANRSGAEYVLAASVRPAASFVRLTARLERSPSGDIVWTTSLDAPSARSIGIADTLAARVLLRLGARRAGPVHTGPPVDPGAYDLYLRGRYYALRRNTADIARGMTLLQRAVAMDSTLALAWATIVRSLWYAGTWRLPVPGMPRESLLARELEASERALVADSGSAEIWIARALALQDLDPTTRRASLGALRRALALDSMSGAAWAALGFALEEDRDTAGALRALRRGHAVDPGNAEVLTNLALHWYWLRQLDSAAAWADSCIAADPALISGRRVAGTIALARGRLEEANAQFNAARNIGPGPERNWSLAGLAAVAAARGDSAQARRHLAEIEALGDNAPLGLHTAVFMAWGLAALGERARAIEWLERFQPTTHRHFQLHLRDLALDPLRGEPRFQALLAAR